MLSYDQALARILNGLEVLPVVDTPLLDCLGKVLARDIVSPFNLPPFDNSAMDGYAVRAADTRGAGLDRPVKLEVVEEIAAGYIAHKVIAHGQAARIFTGGAIPEGADAVIPVEDTSATDSGSVHLHSETSIGDFIREAGGDMRAGEIALHAGTSLRSYEIAQAAAAGRASLDIYRAPRVAVIANGNELVEPGGGALQPGRIYNSNAYAVAAQVAESGGDVSARLLAVDSRDSLRGALQTALQSGADVIVTSGGVSVGDYDFVKAAVEEEGGGEIGFWKVAIRPGKPFVFGRYHDRLFFGLPGNPVSTMVTFELFVRPALRRLAGHPIERCARPLVDAVLLDAATHEPGRRSFQRAWTERRNGRLHTRAILGQGSHRIHGMTQANSLLVLPENEADLPAGAGVKVMLLD